MKRRTNRYKYLAVFIAGVVLGVIATMMVMPSNEPEHTDAIGVSGVDMDDSSGKDKMALKERLAEEPELLAYFLLEKDKVTELAANLNDVEKSQNLLQFVVDFESDNRDEAIKGLAKMLFSDKEVRKEALKVAGNLIDESNIGDFDNLNLNPSLN